MELSEGIAVIEAILFAAGEPVALDRLAKAAEIDTDTATRIIAQLERKYNVSDSGLQIIRLEDSYQIATRAEYAPFIKTALEIRRQTPLSQAAMEALAVVAYNQPVTKAYVEQIRGVDSNGVINSLVERGLIEEAGRLDLPGRPITYRTTQVFLRCFGLSGNGQIPAFPDQEGQMRLDDIGDEGGDLPPLELVETSETADTSETVETPETTETSETVETAAPEPAETAPELADTSDTATPDTTEV
ncbi:MAG: SMC-Scp complex subunit ScpB [Oscillospiraceae bacterium]|nr:SMC-Scp complex subunit ScpB [Oscillospiraceae bacterium]